MSEPPEELTDAEFDDIWPDLAATDELLTALARGDYDAIQKLRDSADSDWWNVAWTLALLLRGFRAGEPSTVALVDSMLGADSGSPEAR